VDFVKENILLILVVAVSGAMLLWPIARRSVGGPWVDTLRATQLINREEAIVLDVREPSEFAQGHILGARNVPLGELERRAEDLARFKSRPVIVCCRSGNRSAAALQALRRTGFEQVYNLSGGLEAWRQAGLPVEGEGKRS